MPMLEKQLAQISDIPSKLDKLIERMERSNSDVANRVTSTMTQTVNHHIASNTDGNDNPFPVPQVLPNWMKWTIIVSILLIAAACISNTIFNIWLTPTNHIVEDTELVTTDLAVNPDTSKIVDQPIADIKMSDPNQQNTVSTNNNNDVPSDGKEFQ